MEQWAQKAPALAAIVALGWALITALQQGYDGTLRLTLVAAIAGLGGYHLRDLIGRR